MSSPSFYSHLKSGKIYTLALVLIAVAAFMTTTFGMRERFASPPVPQDALPADARVEAFTLSPTGFEPREITLPAGEYLLVFNNRTGLDDFALRLEREGQRAAGEARPLQRKRVLRQMHRLTPGPYVITETSHPEWTLRQTVTPR
jgi:hypothetical protein